MPDSPVPTQPTGPESLSGAVSDLVAPVPAASEPAVAAPTAPESAASAPYSPDSIRAGALWGTAMWRMAGSVATQTALISAILYYFGTIRLRATFDYFGVDASALGFSVADNLIHSVNAAFQPLILVGLVALPALTLHRRHVVPVLRQSATPRRTRAIRRLSLIFRTAGVLGCGLVVAGLLDRGDIGQPLGIALPLVLAASVALVGYGHLLMDRRDQPAEAAIPARLRSLVLAVLAITGLLWATGLYAQRIGRDYALYLAANLDARPHVVLYAPERLAIAGAGVQSQDLGPQAGRYRIRYWNLRLLAQRNDMLLLLPVTWAPGAGPVYVIPAAGLRLDVTVSPR
jgi:hypothetical protein